MTYPGSCQNTALMQLFVPLESAQPIPNALAIAKQTAKTKGTGAEYPPAS